MCDLGLPPALALGSDAWAAAWGLGKRDSARLGTPRATLGLAPSPVCPHTGNMSGPAG